MASIFARRRKTVEGLNNDGSKQRQSISSPKKCIRGGGGENHSNAINNLSSVCQTLMSRAGLVLPVDKPPTLHVDQAMFQRDLETILRNHQSYPQVVEEFMDSFGEHIEDVKRLHWCLSMTVTDEDCNCARSSHQESVIRLLLGVLDLQPGLITILLDKLLQLSVDQPDDSQLKCIPKMVLYHIRRLNMLADSETLCDRLLEIMSVASVDIQTEIISCIPEILVDKDHQKVAIAWSELLKQKSELMPAILDAVLMLSIPDDILVEVNHIVLESLDFVELDTFPIVIKFLLHIVTPLNAVEILSEIRLRLKFSSAEISSAACKTDSKQSYEFLTLEVIMRSVRFNKIVGDNLVKVLECSKADREPRLLDLFLIFVLVSVKSYMKAAENVFVTKIRSGAINEALVTTAFKNHTALCREYFKSVLLLTDFLFGATDVALLKFGGLFIQVSFSEISDPSLLQEIIFAVVTRIRNERDVEVETALESIRQIVISQPQKVAPYTVFLKGLFDRLERLSLSHVRKVYDIMNSLGRSSEGDRHGLLCDLHIMVRKQLSNPNPRYRRMGVIGALTTLTRPQSVKGTISDEELSTAKSLIVTIEDLLAKDSLAKALFYDELASAVGRRELHGRLEEWLLQHVADVFQEEYIIDLEENALPDIPVMKGQLSFGGDKAGEMTIVLNLLKVAYADETQIGSSALLKRSQLSVLVPHFRLLRLCEQVTHDSDLSGIDMLLACPVYMFHGDMLSDFESQPLLNRKIVCRCLYGIINWFIELINAFVTQKNDEDLGKVISRIRQLVELRQQLEVCLKSTPGFLPPPAHFESDCVEQPIVPTNSKTSDVAAAKKRGRKRKLPVPSTSTQLSIQGSLSTGSPLDSTIDQPQTSSSKKPVSLNAHAAYFRDFDMNVFIILRRDVELKLNIENDSSSKLSLRELHFLLNDLHSKLEAVFEKPENLKVPFLARARTASSSGLHRFLKSRPVGDVLKQVMKILKSLRVHLELIGTYFIEEKQRDNSDDLDVSIDDSSSKMEAFLVAVECVVLIFGCCTTLFSWKGFDDPANRLTLGKCLTRFAEMKSSSQTSIALCTKNTFDYFNQYVTVVPDFLSACSLVKLLEIIASKSQKKLLDSKLAEVCEEFLKRDWNVPSDDLKTPKYSGQLANLLQTYFNTHGHVLTALEMLTTEIVPEFIESFGRRNCSERFPTMTKASFPIFYEAMFKQLIAYAHDDDFGDEEKSDHQKLVMWSIVIRIFNILVMLIKEFSTHKFLAICLKHGRAFLELFLRYSMPIMDRIFRTHKTEVFSLLKTLQQSTRFLHNVCGQAKVNKNVGLTNSVPRLRKALEAFVYRVKAMLAVNDCKDAFWLGNLKNRNLQGEEILSQSSNVASSDDESAAESQKQDTVSFDASIEDDTGNLSVSY